MKKVFLPIIALLLTLLFAWWTLQTRMFDTMDLWLSSFLYKENAPQPSNTIVVVGIDDRTLSDQGGLGRWQDFKRGYYATVLENIEADKPFVIGMDILFGESSKINPEDDVELSETLAKNNNVVIAGFYQGDSRIDPIEMFRDNSLVGNVFFIPDKDNIVRRIPLILNEHDALSLLMVKRLINPSGAMPPNRVRQDRVILSDSPTRLPTLQNIQIPPLSIPVDEKGQMLINFFERQPATYQHISFVDVYNKSFPAGTFSNKIVLIGANAVGLTTGLYDKQYTPLSAGTPIPGVEIHAHAIETMLQGDYLSVMTDQSKAILVLCIVIGMVLILLSLSTVFAIAATFLALFSYITYAYFSFTQGFIVSISYPIFAIILSFVVTILLKLTLEQKSKRFISKAFAQYISPAVLHKVVQNPDALKLGGEKKDISIFFSDIEGFTTISERYDPEQIVTFLNEYFTELTSLILANQGTIDKFEGDAIMCFFGAPLEDKEHAYHAVKSALECQLRLDQLRQAWSEKGFNIRTRIGINSGTAVVGNIGSKDHFDYTVIGDSVNLASRLEGVNKFYKTSIVVSEFTKSRIQNHFLFRYLDVIRVKGKMKPVQIYEVIGFQDMVSSEKKVMVTAFEKALYQYQEGIFDLAKKSFQTLATECQDPASAVFVERCDYLMHVKPHQWDGVFVMKEK